MTPEGEEQPFIDLNTMFPDIDGFLHAPLLAEPAMCTLHQLQDGTYSIDDVHLMNEIIEFKHARRQQHEQ